MDSEPRPWALYDLSGADAPGNLVEMKEYFRRFHWLQRKKFDGVEATALQTSWCAFITRWNSMLASSDSLPTWLKDLGCRPRRLSRIGMGLWSPRTAILRQSNCRRR
ncbi:hypothetical protein PHMEG_00024729 [Phytophthora megakarya]|uniref:Uncharacterized protein n=1 Tax=Phytophthora megakarya TaxID=4795 RepID=A0A225VGB0_9STRA|nr:hypothetical protein PHMEG_00024729 [Phytophthora megakarya]